MMPIDNHWNYGQEYRNQMMAPEYEPEPEPELEELECPNCEGTGSVAHRCSCGILPTNPAYGYCEACHKPVVWRSCKECGGKGIIN